MKILQKQESLPRQKGKYDENSTSITKCKLQNKFSHTRYICGTSPTVCRKRTKGKRSTSRKMILDAKSEDGISIILHMLVSAIYFNTKSR